MFNILHLNAMIKLFVCNQILVCKYSFSFTYITNNSPFLETQYRPYGYVI